MGIDRSEVSRALAKAIAYKNCCGIATSAGKLGDGYSITAK